MARGQQHPPEVRAAAIAKLMTGASVGQVQREILEEFGIELNEASVRNWKRSGNQAGGIIAESINGVNDSAATDLSESVLALLRQSLTTLVLQQRKFADEKWLHKQDAAALATLFGVTTDKVIRLLEAIERARACDAESS